LCLSRCTNLISKLRWVHSVDGGGGVVMEMQMVFAQRIQPLRHENTDEWSLSA